MKKLSKNFIIDSYDYKLIGLVSSCKEYKLGWIINDIFHTSLKKQENDLISLINKKSVEVSFLKSTENKKFLKLISNKLQNKTVNSHLIPSLSHFDYLLQFSLDFFDFDNDEIINKLKSHNLIQFANFVDIKIIKEKYFLYV